MLTPTDKAYVKAMEQRELDTLLGSKIRVALTHFAPEIEEIKGRHPLTPPGPDNNPLCEVDGEECDASTLIGMLDQLRIMAKLF